MNLFYTPEIAGSTHQLDEAESKHASRVLRLSEGDEVVLIDGAGGWYEARITDAHPKRCSLEVLAKKANYQPLPYHLHVAMAPTKNIDRFEWFLEKATEIGISEITPLLCERSERRQVKNERLERILVSAMKQSLKAYKPVLHEITHLDAFVKEEREGMKAMAHCMEGDRIELKRLGRRAQVTILVGPEGDFTPDEVALAMEQGYRGLSLGESRLRTETAGVHLCSAVSLLHSSSHRYI